MTIQNILGIIGNFAPFHSQTQKIPTTKVPQKSGPSTIGEFQGNVTPPYVINEFELVKQRLDLTHINGRMISVQPITVSATPG